MLDAEHLLCEARMASEKAYAPYSKFPVGAVLLLQSGRVVHGANVENASFGLTICAERSALVSWISQGLQGDAIQAVAIYAQHTPHHHITPCGACRQALMELMSPHATVVFYDATGTPKTQNLATLLPEHFSL
ncbi:MAG: cytidine deaminase [Vampirovibrio sp.]